jgi:uncharacterized YigZ family protein
MERYSTVKEYARFEYEDRKSVFIGEAMPVSSESDAIAFIERVKKKYPDARHHVYAYVLRENNTARFTDDREPQGTAGMPVLDSIRKRGLVDCVVVVTRYFGGTLLGTGGLVRAYSAASSGAITLAQIITYDIYCEIKISCDYSDYGKITPIFDELSFRVTDTEYAEGITVIGKIEKAKADELKLKLTETTSARSGYEILGEKYDF